jgi:hypothetical protein
MPRLIDADRLIESVHSFGIRGAGWSDDERESDVCSMIDDEPTVDAILLVHGKWIDKCARDWHCSVCGKSSPIHFDGYCISDKLNYCCRCGAKMDL